MNALAIILGIAIIGYVIGSISPARIIGSLLMPGQDLSNTKVAIPNSDQANIRYRGVSATSLGAKLGPRWGITIGILDLLKGLLPPLIIFAIFGSWPLAIWCGTLIMIGHNWPIFHAFHGGRGQSVMIGTLLLLDPLAPIICYPLGILIGLFILRDMFIAYTLGQFLLIPWFWFFGSSTETFFAIAINLIYVVAALPETRDYLREKQKGNIGKLNKWSEFFNAHPAMGEDRFDRKD